MDPKRLPRVITIKYNWATVINQVTVAQTQQRGCLYGFFWGV